MASAGRAASVCKRLQHVSYAEPEPQAQMAEPEGRDEKSVSEEDGPEGMFGPRRKEPNPPPRGFEERARAVGGGRRRRQGFEDRVRGRTGGGRKADESRGEGSCILAVSWGRRLRERAQCECCSPAPVGATIIVSS